MKLVRYGNPGKEKPGLIDDNGQLRDLSAVVKDIGPGQLGDAALAKLRKQKLDKLPLVKGKPRYGCPVAGVGKFIAIGLNYADHAAESGLPIPAEPVVFMKATSCIQGPNDPVMLPRGSVKTAIFDQMTPEHIAFMRSKIPMGRFGTVEEVAALVGWLCTEDCSFSTGAVFDLSGGRSTY